MFATLAWLVLGFALLAAGGEVLIRSSTRLAEELGVSRLFIGLTVVALGTSAPEGVVSVVAALQGATDIALGNVVGSNVFNVLLILGLSALIAPLAVSRQLVRFDVPFLVFISLLLFGLSLDGSVGRAEGLLFLGLLAAQIAWSYRKAVRERGGRQGDVAIAPVAPADLPRPPSRVGGLAANAALTLASLGLLVLGSRWLVWSATELARWLGLSDLVIGLTVVAAGTSLPEAATSVMAAVRGERDIAVGNVVGSNVFNILGVLGLSAFAAPAGIPIPSAALAFDLPVMVAVAVICLPIFFNGWTVHRWEGALLLTWFALFTAYVLLRATHHDALSGFTAVVGYGVLPATFLTILSAALANVLRARGKPVEP